MIHEKIMPVCAAIVLGAFLSACETPTVYQAAPNQSPPAVAQRPSFTPGDEFWFHIGGTSILVEQFQGVENGLLAFRRELQKETRFYSPELALVRIENDFGDYDMREPDNGEMVFPLAVGDTWSRSYRLRSDRRVYLGRFRRDCEVLDSGQVNTPAGTFLALRIACSLRDLDKATPSQEEIIYAPAVGRIVHRRSLGRGTELSLIEFTRAK